MLRRERKDFRYGRLQEFFQSEAKRRALRKKNTSFRRAEGKSENLEFLTFWPHFKRNDASAPGVSENFGFSVRKQHTTSSLAHGTTGARRSGQADTTNPHTLEFEHDVFTSYAAGILK